MKTENKSTNLILYIVVFIGLVLMFVLIFYFTDKSNNFKNTISSNYSDFLRKSKNIFSFSLSKKIESSNNATSIIQIDNEVPLPFSKSEIKNIEKIETVVNEKKEEIIYSAQKSNLPTSTNEEVNSEKSQINYLENDLVSKIDNISKELIKLRQININSEKLYIINNIWKIERAINIGAPYYSELIPLTKYLAISDSAIKLSLNGPPTIQTLYLDLQALIDDAIEYEAHNSTDKFIISRFSSLIGLKYDGTEIAGLELQQYQVAASSQRILNIANHLFKYSLPSDHPFQQWLVKFSYWQERQNWLNNLWKLYNQ